MITVNSSDPFDKLFDKSEEDNNFLRKISPKSSFMDFINWLKHNKPAFNFTKNTFVVNKAFISDDEFQDTIKLMCQFTGRSLSFYFSDLDNQWILNYTPYLDSVLPIVEAVAS